MNRLKFIFALFIISCFSCSTEELSWPEPTHESRPWTRWWWMGNAVDKENIKHELKEMADAGIGGVEITSIYGVKGEEERFIEYLSPDFKEILEYTIGEADKLGMGVDLPPGSGWRCGGPFVPEEKGLWSLQLHKFDVKRGQAWTLPSNIEGASLLLFKGTDGTGTLIQSEEQYKPDIDGVIYVAGRIKNSDKVKRASIGGEGWAIDTFNEEITNWYLDEFSRRLGIDKGLVRCYFHDSFEYTGDFTNNFTEEFKRRRGYDIANYLDVLAGDCEDEEMEARIKSDYRETLSDLVLESFIQPMTKWAHGNGSKNRNQAHGSPGNILDLYAACDIPETEIYGSVDQGKPDVFVNKFASSAAHVTNQKLISSESFTWLNGHWTVTTSDMVRATNRFFLAGVNHMFFHGTCYSPADAEWPGWLFYAATQVNNRNPLWRELPALFKYIERCQTVMQSSKPQNDLLVYWPYYDVAAGEGRIFNHIGVHRESVWFKGEPIAGLSEELVKAGYTFDYISDKQLSDCKIADGQIVTSGGAVYKALIIPETKYIPVNTLSACSQLLSDGGTLLFDKSLPGSVPGIYDLENREKALNEIKNTIDQGRFTGNIVQLLKSSDVTGEVSLAEKGFDFLKMRMNGNDWYMVFNCSEMPQDEYVRLNSESRDYIFFSPMNGEITRASAGRQGVRIQLEAEEAVFIMCSDKRSDVPDHIYYDNSNEKEIKGIWKISFLEGGPVFPGDITSPVLKSWTGMGDAETVRFAGTAKYSLEFELDEEINSAFLDLGDVRDCARVKVNGKDYGSLLGPAFRVRIDNFEQGKNSLEVEITNVAANRIRDLDQKGVVWKKFYDINFISLGVGQFDASGWEVRDAGLLGPVMLIVPDPPAKADANK